MVNWNQEQPAPKALWKLLRDNFAGILPKQHLGIYVVRKVAGTSTPSLHSEGRAIDLPLVVTSAPQKLLADQLFLAFQATGISMGLDHVIWNRQIWSAGKGGPRPYTGASPHTDHMHVAFTRDGSQKTTFGTFGLHVASIRTGLEDLVRAHAGFP